jgi:hypothetical protein
MKKFYWPTIMVIATAVAVLGALALFNLFFGGETDEAPVPKTRTVVTADDSTGATTTAQVPVSAKVDSLSAKATSTAKVAIPPSIKTQVPFWQKAWVVWGVILLLAVALIGGIGVFIRRNNRRPLYPFGGTATTGATSSAGGGDKWAAILAFLGKIFSKDSEFAHYIWWGIALLLFLPGLYCAPLNPLASWPLILLACVCFSVGKNHLDAQTHLADATALNAFWVFRHNWSSYRIWWFYLALGLGWLAFTLGRLHFLWRTIR